MARITIYLPDDVRDQAGLAGIDIAEVCRRAVVARLSRLRGAGRPAGGDVEAETGRHDDHRRFQQGLELGMGWARTAPAAAVEAVAAWSGLRWRQFKVPAAAASLAAAYCRDNALPEPPPDAGFWFERNAYTLGVIEGVATARERQLTA